MPFLLNNVDSQTITFISYYFCYTGCILISSILFCLMKTKHGFGPNKWPPVCKKCCSFQPLGFITALCGTPSWLHSTLALTDSKLSGLAITSINPTGLVVFVRGPLLCHRSPETPHLIAPSTYSVCSTRLMKLCPRLVQTVSSLGSKWRMEVGTRISSRIRCYLLHSEDRITLGWVKTSSQPLHCLLFLPPFFP